MESKLNVWISDSWTSTYNTGYFTITVDKYPDGWIIAAEEIGFYAPYPVLTESELSFVQERALFLVKDYLKRRYQSL